MQATHMGALRKLLARARGWAPLPDIFIGLIISTFFISVLSLAFPIALLQVYDRVIPNDATHTLVMLLLVVGGALILEALLKSARSAISAWADARYEHRIGCQAFQRVLSTRLTDYEKHGSGAHLDRISSINSLKDFYGGQVITSLLDIPFVILFLGFIAFIGGYLVFVPIVTLTIFITWVALMSQKLKTVLLQKRNAEARRLNFIIEVLNCIHTVKSMAMEAQIIRRYERLQKKSSGMNYFLTSRANTASIGSQLVYQITLVLIVAIGSIQVIHGNLTIGGLAACTLLTGRTLQPFGRAVSLWTRLQSIKISQKRLADELSLPVEPTTGSKDLSDFEGKIKLHNVSFAYNIEAPILQDVNLEINAGEAISIVGDNLNGKSTLIWIMMGILEPDHGRILYDDKPIHNYNLQKLREKIAYLPQHGALLEGTLMENLTMFKGPKYHDRARRAAEVMGLNEVINKLPQGYDTPVGDQAVSFLPRGIVQRICIARALTGNPRVLIFDEANTGFDMSADERLKQILLNIKGKCTLVLISHRPSILEIADRRFALTRGTLELKEQAS